MHRSQPKQLPPLILCATIALSAAGCERQPAFVSCSSRLAGAVAAPTPPALPGAAAETSQASRQRLRAWVEMLADPSFEGRRAATESARRTAALLESYFRDLGLEAPREGAFCQPLWTTLPGDQNVLAHRLGDAASPPRPLVLVAAHYDALGTSHGGAVHPGADDNASGVAALTELARLAVIDDFPVDLVFAAFGAEELSAAGSRFYVERPSIPLERLALVLNFDMVGRSTDRVPRGAMGYVARGPEPGLAAALSRLGSAAEQTGLELVELGDQMTTGGRSSDTRAFLALAPTLHLTTGLHDDYHRPTDTPDRIDYEQIAAAVELASALLRRLEDP